MAFPGQKSADLIYFQTPQDTVDATGRTDAGGFKQQFYIDPFLTGTHTEQTEVTVGRVNPGGYIAASFVGDFYNRVHFSPNPADYGAITATTERIVRVWNAHLVSNALNTLTITSGIGVTLTTGGPVPVVFGALEEIALGFTADRDGVPSFDEFFSFAFDLKDPYLVLFTGDRAVLIERGPNWRDPLIEEFVFKTGVINRSRSGREQRRSLRQEARRVVSYTMSVWTDRRRTLEGLLTQWRRRTVLTPMWPYRCFLTATTSAGSAVLTVDQVPGWALAGMNVMYGDQTGVIDSTGANTITLSSPVLADVPTGTAVIQMMTARLTDGLRVQKESADVEEAPVRYQITPGVDPEYSPPTAPETYGGYEVFRADPNWGAGVDTTWDMPLDEIDAEWGQIAFYEYQDFVQNTSRYVYSGLRDDSVRDVTDFFLRQRGQRGEFWMPTFGVDIIAGYQLDESAAVIRIVGTEFEGYWANQTVAQAVMVELTDGTVFYRGVTDVSTTTDAFGTDSVISLDAVWPYDIPVESILKISWLMRCRFATDTLRIEWLTDQKANVQFSVLTLEAL